MLCIIMQVGHVQIVGYVILNDPELLSFLLFSQKGHLGFFSLQY